MRKLQNSNHFKKIALSDLCEYECMKKKLIIYKIIYQILIQCGTKGC